MPTVLPRALTPLLPVLAVALAASGCSLTESKSSTAKSGRISVESSAKDCHLSATSAPAGKVTFTVKNTGDAVTEFYVYDSTGQKIVGEVENIGPGLSRDLVTSLPKGSYISACKPGMSGQGIRATFTVTGSSGSGAAPAGVSPAQVEQAVSTYRGYVREQSAALLAGTRAFAAAYRAGRDDQARRLYVAARVHWERIEPVAESFGDLDPKLDAREADLQPGEHWTGWHRLEKDLWRPAGTTALTPTERATYSTDLVGDTATLDRRVQGLTFTLDQIGNGSISLLDEVASKKVTGEEEAFSHTDLSDVQANLDGARAGFDAVADVLAVRNPVLARSVAQRFDALQQTLHGYRRDGGFVAYTEVDQARRKQLSDAVNALAEPLSKVTGDLVA